jgi:ABC-type uncharacterized transport system ATPase subunit
MIMYLRRKTSDAAGYGLGTTIKYLRGAAGIGKGTTIKYLRGAASIGLGQFKLILSPKQREKPAASRTRTYTNTAV